MKAKINQLNLKTAHICVRITVHSINCLQLSGLSQSGTQLHVQYQ